MPMFGISVKMKASNGQDAMAYYQRAFPTIYHGHAVVEKDMESIGADVRAVNIRRISDDSGKSCIGKSGNIPVLYDDCYCVRCHIVDGVHKGTSIITDTNEKLWIENHCKTFNV